ncbi:uncharacterized protein LOC134798019 [Cydia splendana]|uniref:uncharacterized protein LOC134798019 n=1 Tax=Cydia splendana TaxID=1100963 RepID=UPI00300CB289
MAPIKKYSPEQMGWAIDAVRRGSNINDAAQRFNVPRATLHNKITGKSPKECSMGPSTVLSKTEEDILEVWIKDMADKHIPVTKDTLLDSVQSIIIEKKQNTPFTKNRPGKKWYSAFLKRHPEIAERTAQNLCKARDNVTEDEIEKWFSEVESDLKKRGLSQVLEHPERIFNTDESAFFLNPKPGRVLAKTGQKFVYSCSGDEKKNLTVLITGNAAGNLAPTMVVYDYARIPPAISATYPKDWGIGRSESGWMCSGTFYEYVTNVFNPWLIKENIEKPVLLFLDGHSSHLTLHLANFCSRNGIEVVALNPHSTHIMQPMDVAVFRPLKLSWREEVRTWKMQNLGQVLEKHDFAPVFKTGLEKITVATIKNGFRASGLYPFGPEYVNMSKTEELRNNKKRKIKEKIPFTITSPAWLAYSTKKEEEKKKLLKEKELRVIQREEKKNEKANNKKTNVKKQRNNIKSTETEILHLQSDESVTSDALELDDGPLSTLFPSPMKVTHGSYVIVLYEGQHFPGIVNNVNNNEYEVSTMTFSSGKSYKWPEKPDKTWYRKEQVVEVIKPPILLNKRGFYSVKEMEKYSDYTY